MRTNTLLVALLLVLLTPLLPARSLALPPADWESLRQQGAGIEEAATRAERAEDAAVAELFALNRTLEETRTAMARLDAQIGAVTGQLTEAERERDRLEGLLGERLIQFGRRVRYYAENGNFAPVGFLLESQSFANFLFRIEVLTQVLERDSRLTRELRELTAQAKALEQLLAARRAELSSLHEKQAAEAARLRQEIARKETFLAGLQEQRSAVEAKAAELEAVWAGAARPVLEALGHSLQTMALRIGDITPDAVRFSIMPPGAAVTVSEESLNAFIAREGDLRGLVFDLIPGHAILEGEYGGIRMHVIGRFVLKSKTEVRFEPVEVRFHDVLLPKQLTADLLAEGRLDMDFSALIGIWAVKEILVQDGAMVVGAGLR